MDVRLPDGTIIKNVPDGTTKADLVGRLQRNGMAVPAEWLQASAPPTPPTDRQLLLASAPMRLAKGMKDPVDGSAQLIQRVLPNELVNVINKAADFVGGPGTFAGDVLGIKGMTTKDMDADIAGSNAEYEAARKAAGQTGFDAVRFAGNVVSPVNAATARVVPVAPGKTVAGMALAGAVGGATGATTQPVTGGEYWESKAGQVALGALGGAVLTPVLTRAAEGVARSIRERFRTGSVPSPEAIQNEIRASFARDDIDVGQIPREVMNRLTQDVQQAMSQGREVNAAAILRRLDFERFGMQPLTGQITRDPTQYARELDLRGIQGVGEPIARRLNEQQGQIASLMRRNVGGAQDPYTAGENLINRLRQADEGMQRNVTAGYNAFRQSTGREIELPLSGLAQDYAATLRDFGETIPSAVRRQFEGLGLMSGTQRRLLTIEDGENLIKVINKNYDPANRAQARALDELRRSVQNTILQGTETGAGMEAGALANMARDTARNRFQAIEQTPALRAAINDVAPDKFVDRFVIKGNVRDINRMAELVGPEGREVMRQQIMRYLEERAFGANAAGDGAARQATFNRELNSIGRNKLTALLGEQQTDDLYRMGRVMAYIQQRPAGSAVNESNTGAAVANLLSKISGTVKGAPYINDFIIKPIGAARERGEVRNALAAALESQTTQLEPETINRLAQLLAPVPVGGGAALGYSVR